LFRVSTRIEPRERIASRSPVVASRAWLVSARDIRNASAAASSFGFDGRRLKQLPSIAVNGAPTGIRIAQQPVPH